MDWKKLAQAHEKEIIADLTELVAINSACDTEHKTADFPLGPGPAKALQKMLSFGERDGFVTKNVDNLGGHIEYGQGSETLGILAHVDTVPAGEGWDDDAFTVREVDGKLFGRGTLDDKGPTLAAYYAVRILKEQGVEVNKRIRMIFGTDEESQWRGINRYFEVEPLPDFGFSPDAEFPVINGEKGIASYTIEFKDAASDVAQVLEKFESGLRDNMVPQTAMAVVKTDNTAQLSQSFTEFVQQNAEISGEVDVQDDQHVALKLSGKGAHAMEPQSGVNAGTYLAVFLAQQELDEQGSNYVNFITDYLHLDYHGHKSKVGYEDAVMGPLTQSPDIFSYTSQDNGKIVVNVRYPKGNSDKDILEKYQQLSDLTDVSISGHVQTPHFVPEDDPLVQNLLKAYRNQTNDQTAPFTVGGGTFGRILERGVAFGALLPDGANVMHQANEFITVENLIAATAIYAEAIWNLVK